jgi:hypothetical protein
MLVIHGETRVINILLHAKVGCGFNLLPKLLPSHDILM